MWRWLLAGIYCSVLFYSKNHLTPLPVTLATIFLLLSLLGPYNLWLIHATSARDSKALYRYLSLRWKIFKAQRYNLTVPKFFQQNVRNNPDKIAFYFEEEKWTFQELEDYSNKVANYFKGQGFKQGDCVALMMVNCVEYVGIWLGLAKLGVIPALLNYNLRSKSLMHCINIVNCKGIICGPEFQEAVEEIASDLGGLKIYVGLVTKYPKYPLNLLGAVDLDAAIKNGSVSSPDELDQVNFKDKLVYIYTSGTTGLPKAAVITHSRYTFAAMGGTYMIGILPTDIVYTPLPLYHLAAGILGSGQSIMSGRSVVLRPKFSVNNYWKDCAKYNVTVRLPKNPLKSRFCKTNTRAWGLLLFKPWDLVAFWLSCLHHGFHLKSIVLILYVGLFKNVGLGT